ncbi:hypothetical protein [Acaryochloris sp. CCMEE 5410]|uniref:hypothetical protein n=1 Tax=Acaryochloris sp. CCMEE 5410 TaxID=310037 RepID=UPI0002484072|nr:hypothetical protein [Acaryochloris sp. CCMEE 5410]KAI9135221.1 hypothetical protein ON05_019585 [Acaryochloris sp. CCMEE 5410]
MPEEQPTPAESEADIKEPQANLEKPDASDSEKATTNIPPKAESTATTFDSSAKAKPTDLPSESSKSASKSSSQSEEKKEPISAAADRAGKPKADKLKSARPQPGKGPKSTAAKGVKSKTESSEGEVIGDSPIEAVLTQIVGTVGKVLGSILSAIGNQVKKTSFYSKIEPGVKVISWLWNNIIVTLGNVVIKPIWGIGLKILRGRFPNGLKSFSDRFLTVVILSIATLIYWLFSSLIPPSQPTVQQPPDPAPVAKAPAPVAQPTPVSPPSTPVTEAPVEEPPPPPEPARKQIIEVQSQVAQVFDQYSQDIVQSVQANFQDERLVIKVSDRWFELSRSEQNQLGTDALERSRKLDFPKLEIRDQTDQLLAREPVVGSNIIVLQRRTTPPELTTDSPA